LYLIQEMAGPFLVSLLVFTFILLMTKVLELTELLILGGVKAGDIIDLLTLSLPFFLSMTVPLSTLLGVLLCFLRLSGDNEITVLKSSGVGLYQLLPPVILFCLWAYLLTSFLTLELVPRANWSFRNKLLTLAKEKADVAVKERYFNDMFEGMVVYVNHIPVQGEYMEDLFIRDDRDEETSSVIVASRGRLATDAEKRALILQLLDGTIDRVRRDQKSTDTIFFDKYELRLSLEDQWAESGLMRRNQTELGADEIWRVAREMEASGHRQYPIYIMEAHYRLAMPLACLVLGLIAVSLGVEFRRGGRHWGVTTGGLVYLVYYIILATGRSLGESGRFPPALAMWLPNLLTGAAGLYMLYRANNERPLRLSGPFEFVARSIKSGGKNAGRRSGDDLQA
jgi:lipopolysaccharide export system permease protein